MIERRQVAQERHATTRNTLYQIQKNHSGGNFKKYAKGFLVGRVRVCSDRRRGSLAVPLELGSRKSVKLHQNSRITEIVALSGGFFSDFSFMVRMKGLAHVPRARKSGK